MLKFGKYIGVLLFTLVAGLYLLDYLFTAQYYTGTPRDKISWVKHMSDSDLDYILLGSSRCKYFIQPKIIEAETGLKGLNLADIAQGPLEIKLMLKEFLVRNTPKQVYIQIDYSHNTEAPDTLGRVQWMPYLKEKRIYQEFEKYGSEYRWYKDIPLNRFLKFGPKIGLRNISLIAAGKQGRFIAQDGYVAKYGTQATSLGAAKWTLSDTPNIHINEIIDICKDAKIELYFFTSPAYQNSSDMSVLERRLPNYKYFSRSILEQKYFLSDGYINPEGSKLFTSKFQEHYFPKVQ
jgi:hypothetical protein